MSYIPRTIYIDDRAKKYPLTRRICKKFPYVATHIIHDTKSFIKEYNKRSHAITKGKKDLLLTINKGRFIKKCPGTKHYICCGYQILHQASGCNLDCSYCILQAYFNNPLLTVFVNLDNMMQELDKKIDRNKKRFWRIGTGEFTDSLALDEITSLSTLLIPYFIKKKNAILELKTKTVNINNLLRFKPKGNIITSWSLNAKRIVKQEERQVSSIQSRIKAARTCQDRG